MSEMNFYFWVCLVEVLRILQSSRPTNQPKIELNLKCLSLENSEEGGTILVELTKVKARRL
jgi:hypothetical protein